MSKTILEARPQEPSRTVEKTGLASQAVSVHRNFLAVLATLIGGFFVWISLVGEPQMAAGDHLDRSWREAYTHYLKNHLQAGSDYLFSSGPLGHFYSPVYDAELFGLDYFVELCLKAWLAFVFLRFAFRIPSLMTRLAFCAAVGLPILFIGYMPDSVWVLALMLSMLTIIRSDEECYIRDIAPFSMTLAVVSLMKFTFLVLGFVLMAILIVNFVVRQKFKPLLLLLFWCVSSFLVGWILCHQSLRQLPTYLVQSLDIASGYSEAMSFEVYSNQPYLVLAIASFVLFSFVWLPATTSERQQFWTLRFWSIASAIAVAIALTWKHAFVRADAFHVPGFLWILASLTFLCPVFIPLYDWRAPLRVCALSGCGFLSLFGFFGIALGSEGVSLTRSVPRNIRNHLTYIFLPGTTKLKLEANRQELATQFALPKMKARIGKDTVDIFSHHQGVLFLNDLNWSPRPVLHGYSTYTQKLLALNAEFFRSSQAPQFVILKLDTIDGRFPTADDGLALKEILSCYRPLFDERGYLLMERVSVAEKPEPSKVVEFVSRFDESIELNAKPGSYQTMGLRVRLSTRGRLQKLFYQAPKLYIELTMSDGTSKSFRLVPAMVEQGVLLNPLLRNTNDLEDFLEGRQAIHVEQIRIHRSSQYGFDDEITLRIEDFPMPAMEQNANDAAAA
jgi:hypothetical protein